MFDVSPNYYAKNTQPSEFILKGLNFDLIPDNAIGIYSRNNNDPLQYIQEEEDIRLYTIIEKSDTSLTLHHKTTSDVSVNVYLGGIVSPDRTIVYWVNNTKPLP